MSTELATAPKKGNTLYDVITSQATANKLRAQMATHVSPERLARVAWGALMKTPKLMTATQESIMFCIAECARIGLEPSLGRVYLIPFENKKKGVVECQIMIGYQGFLDLARRSGIVSSINARCVYSNERFEYKITVEQPILVHEPCLGGEKGELRGAYCIARFKDGGSHVEYMTKAEIDTIRNRSNAVKAAKRYGNETPWDTDYDAMALKTVVRRAAKFWPLTTASPELADAIQMSDDNDYIDADFEIPKQSGTERLKAACGIGKTEPAAEVVDAEEDEVDPELQKRVDAFNNMQPPKKEREPGEEG